MMITETRLGLGATRARVRWFGVISLLVAAGCAGAPTVDEGGDSYERLDQPPESVEALESRLDIDAVDASGHHDVRGQRCTKEPRSKYAGRLGPARLYPGSGMFNGLRAVGNHLYASGYATTPIDLGGAAISSPAGFVVKLDRNGSADWLRRFTHADSSLAGVDSLATDPSGNSAVSIPAQFPLYLDGQLISPGFGDWLQYVVTSLEPDGDLRWVAGPFPRLNWTANAFDDCGNLFTFGSSTLTKLTPSGAQTWTRPVADTVDPSAFMDASDTATDQAGNVLVVANYRGNFTIAGVPLATQNGFGSFVGKYAPDGTPVWHRSVPGPGFTSVVADSVGNVIVIGRSFQPVDLGTGPLDAGGQQLLVAKYTGSGVPLFAKAWRARSWQSWQQVDVDPSDNIVLNAFIDSTVDLGGGALSPNGVGVGTEGELAFVVAKLDRCGNHLWSRLVDDGADDIDGSIAGHPFPSITSDRAGTTWISTWFRTAIEVAGRRIDATPPFDANVLLLRFSR